MSKRKYTYDYTQRTKQGSICANFMMFYMTRSEIEHRHHAVIVKAILYMLI